MRWQRTVRGYPPFRDLQGALVTPSPQTADGFGHAGTDRRASGDIWLAIYDGGQPIS